MKATERKLLNRLLNIKELINKNVTYSDIAAYLNITDYELSQTISSLKGKGFSLPKFPRKAKNIIKYPEDEKIRRQRLDKVLKLRDNGKRTYEEIGQELGITRQRAHQLVKQAREELIPNI